MKSIAIILAISAAAGFSSCKKCYTCTTALGTETECCGKKSECERFQDDCSLTGGTID